MGSWNSTCAVSNLHIRSGQEVVVFMLEKRHKPETNLCYNNSFYQLCRLPFYGQNDSYGAVEDCHGAGLDLLLSEIRDNLYEMPLGDNQYHEIAVTKEEFDIQLLFEADHESRLFINTDPDYFGYENEVLKHYKKKMKNGEISEDELKHKKHLEDNVKRGVDPYQRITHIQVHAQVFNDILDKYKIEYFAGNKTKKISFAEAVKQIPEVIEALNSMKKSGIFDIYTVNLESNIVASFFGHASMYDSSRLLAPLKTIKEIMLEDKSDKEVEEIMVEFLKGFWFNSFMSTTRKMYTPQCGVGSQSENLEAYSILNKSVGSIIKAEKKERTQFDEHYG